MSVAFAALRSPLARRGPPLARTRSPLPQRLVCSARRFQFGCARVCMREQLKTLSCRYLSFAPQPARSPDSFTFTSRMNRRCCARAARGLRCECAGAHVCERHWKQQSFPLNREPHNGGRQSIRDVFGCLFARLALSAAAFCLFCLLFSRKFSVSPPKIYDTLEAGAFRLDPAPLLCSSGGSSDNDGERDDKPPFRTLCNSHYFDNFWLARQQPAESRAKEKRSAR